jgi:hypothetical protein
MASRIASICAPEATDVLVGDVGDLLEHEPVDLAALDALARRPAAHVDEERVARTDATVTHAGQVDDALVVATTDDEHAAVLEELATAISSPRSSKRPDPDDLQRIVEQELLAGLEHVSSTPSLRGLDLHLAPLDGHGQAAIRAGPEVGAERVGRRGQPLDLRLQLGDLRACGPQRLGQTAVLRDRRLQLLLRGLELILEGRDAFRSGPDALTQQRQLGLQQRDSRRRSDGSLRS